MPLPLSMVPSLHLSVCSGTAAAALFTPTLLERSLRPTALAISAALTLPVEAEGSPLALAAISTAHAFAQETRIRWSWADRNNGLA